MFNRKLKQKITVLEKELMEAKKIISEKDQEINLLKFQVDNPPKFKIGDKVGNFIIIDKKPFSLNLSNFMLDSLIMISAGIELYKLKKEAKTDLTEFNKKYSRLFSNQWQYEVININTGKKETKKEFELL